MDTYYYRLKYAGFWCGGYILRGLDLASQYLGSLFGAPDVVFGKLNIPKTNLTPIQWFQYDFEVAEWQTASCNSPALSKLPTNNSNIKIATFNVFSTEMSFIDEIVCTTERFTYTCQVMLPSLNADVICLSEVTHEFLPHILSQKWVQDNFFTSSRDASHCAPKGNLILCRKQLAGRLFVEVEDITAAAPLQPSPSGSRPAFVAEINWNAYISDGFFVPRTLLVTSVHLTAFEQRFATRRIQLEQLVRAIEQVNHENSHPVLILGDFNFHSEEENASMPAEDWLDIWSHLRGQEGLEVGYTYDCMTNSMVKRCHPSEARRMRLDRCFISKQHQQPSSESSTKNPAMLLVPNEIHKFGTEPIPQSPDSHSPRPGTFPSDHFGLVVQLAAHHSQ